jgi:hypothetical protein
MPDAKCNYRKTRRRKPAPNCYRIEGETAYIVLTDAEGNPVAESLISVEDLPRVIDAGRWHVQKKTNTWYASRCIEAGGKRGRISLHRFILQPADGLVPDHINGNGLDNRRENLRAVTESENCRNRRGIREKGRLAHIHPIKGTTTRFRVRMRINGEQMYFGTYDTIEEAATAAEEARRKHGILDMGKGTT